MKKIKNDITEESAQNAGAERFPRFDWNARLMALCIAFISLFGLLIVVRLPSPDMRALIITIGCAGSIYFCARLFPRFNIADPLTTALATFLGSFGALYQYSLTQTFGGMMQTFFYAVGLAVFCATSIVTRKWVLVPGKVEKNRLPLIGVSAAALALPMVMSSSRQWIYLGFGGLSIQPSELVKVAFIIILADILKDKKLRHPVMVSAFLIALFVGMVALQNDFGSALVYYAAAVALVFIAAPSLRTILLETGVSAALAFGAYNISDVIQKRFKIFTTSFTDFTKMEGQLSSSLMSLANGGVTGTGLGLGRSGTIPVYSTDFVFAVVCEEFGFVFGIVLLFMIFLLVWQMLRVAGRAGKRFHAMLAAGCAVVFGVQAFLIAGGVIKMIPLTGVTLPFISGGGSSLVSLMAMCGIVGGVSMADAAPRRARINDAGYTIDG
ncbi:MAG: FtsW/RodA/SpoVE family cell cycle protein [Oscillospiraceae bacterium]|jgi:cell division protein FtsW (lipid II flippase)|nr:FtsW/RodA/SpoVE family cell cycle protein [Oscillospiraceae bacterium]